MRVSHHKLAIHAWPNPRHSTPVAYTLAQVHEPPERVRRMRLVCQPTPIVPDGVTVFPGVHQDTCEIEMHLRKSRVLRRLQRVCVEVQAQRFSTLSALEHKCSEVIVCDRMAFGRELDCVHVGLGGFFTLTAGTKSSPKIRI